MHLAPTMSGQYHGETSATQESNPVIDHDVHLDLQYCLIAHVVMTQLSMKEGLNT